MDIAIVHVGNLSECLTATSLTTGLLQKYNDAKISWVVKDADAKNIFKYNKKIYKVFSLAEFYLDLPKKYDILFNLTNKIQFFPDNLFKINKIMGSGTDEKIYDVAINDILSGNKKINKSLFQIYYKMCGMSWAGEGYDICYCPKNKQKKGTIGLSLGDVRLRDYVLNNLKMPYMKKWYIPNKKNILKKYEEINRCKHIITDDYLTLNIALSLKKYVYFTQTVPCNYGIEMFGSGEIFNVPKEIFK